MARLAASRTTALSAEEIVEVALRRADDFGLDSLTMATISAELNVSQMALYRLFDSKHDLLQAALDRVWSEAMEIGELPSDPLEVLVTSAGTRPPQRDMARRLAEGKSRKEIIRCLKRHIARKIHHAITADTTGPDQHRTPQPTAA
jgi:AcrR family transcriptional regulator